MKIHSFVATLLLAMSTAQADTPVLIFAGQSNMGGYATNTHELSPAQLAEQPNVLFYGDNCAAFQPVNLGVRPTQSINSGTGSGFGPEAVVGKDLVDAGLFPKVLEIKYIMNGGPSFSFLASPEDAEKSKAPNPITTTWAPDVKSSPPVISLYQLTMDRIKTARADYTAKTGEKTYIAGFFWMQGESDACSSPEVAAMYDQNLKRFVAALRRDFEAPDMPFIFGRIHQTPNFPKSAIVRGAEDNVVKPDNAQFIPNAFEVDTDSLPMSGDDRHFSSAGEIALGHEMARGYQEITKKK